MEAVFMNVAKRISVNHDMLLYASLKKWLRFLSDFKRFKKLSTRGHQRFHLLWKDIYPCLGDRTKQTNFDRHYVYHLGWAARIIARTNPDFHVDISSSLYFSSMISAFVPVQYYDYRPADLQLTQFSSEYADLLSLPFGNEQIQSLSCMHAVEHVGLGRYGDSLDPDGDLKAFRELQRILAERGSLLLVVPVGKPRIMFNAHRIYAYRQILSYFSELDLEEFALIPDDPKEGGVIHHAVEALADAQQYGCGCFWFRK